MKLSEENRTYLIQRDMEVFDRSKEEATIFIQMLQNMLNGTDKVLLYELQYNIFKTKNDIYTRKLIKFFLEGSIYLYECTTNEKDKRTLLEHVKNFFDFIFIQKCVYSREVEAQSQVSHHILKSVSERLNSVLQTQERMIASLSHEMRTSLNTIQGYLNIIEESGAVKGEQKFQLKKAIHGAESLRSLVKDILNVTKINSGQLEIEKSFFAVDEMLLQCIDHVSIQIKKKEHIRFEYKTMFTPFLVYGDQMHIMEIIINFLTNAFKYTKEGFVKLKMEFSQEPEGINMVFSVTDSGVGMTSEQLQDIFNPYSRYQKNQQGLGLGLHITKQLAVKLGGKLDVESEVGKGTTFSFSYLFRKTKPLSIDVKDKKIYFYIDRKMQDSFYIQEKIRFLKQHGANVKVLKREGTLINFLLSTHKNVPDILSVHAEAESYSKIDALIYYLRSAKLFNKTLFIAESMHQDLSLKYFDELYEYCAPMSIYEKLQDNLHNEKKKINQRELSILVIDDTQTNLDIFRLFIQRDYPHANVDLAGGGYEGIGMCKAKVYDIIFLDLKMPGLDGFQVIRKLKELDQNLPPVYAFTADVYKSTYERVKEVGFSGMLEKPLDPTQLKKILEGV